jgi:phosphoribosylformylglycinamidine synthase subunit PurQ / glutaminase
VVPVKNGEGRYYADPDTLDELEANGQVVFRYALMAATPTAPSGTSPGSATRPATSSG